MSWKWMPLLISLFGSFHVAAEQSTQAELQDVVRNLEKVRMALKTSAAHCQAYTPRSQASCTFENYCSDLGSRASDFYLYQDPEGRQVPNYQMVAYLDIAEFCAKKPFAQTAISDPFVYPKLLFDEELAGGKKQLREHQDRVRQSLVKMRATFSETQKTVVQFLEKKKTSANSREIDNMISRIKSVRFQTPSLSSGYEELIQIGCESPNAFYDPQKNTILVCPQLGNLPESALFSTLAHEFGHAIDSCSMSFDFSEEGGIFPEWMGYDSNQHASKVKAVPYARQPFSKILECLRSTDSIAVGYPSKNELLQNVDKELELAKQMYEDIGGEGEEKFTDASEASFEEQKNHIIKNYEKGKHCRSFTGSAHMQEAFSDWLSSQVIAEKLQSIPDTAKAKEFAFSSQAFFYANECGNIRQVIASKLTSATGNTCNDVIDFKSFATSSDSMTEITHPKTSRRVNRILYAQPTIQKALGCRPLDNGKECK